MGEVAVFLIWVLFGKHIDKFEQDKRKGIHTLPVILGEKNARMVSIILAIWNIHPKLGHFGMLLSHSYITIQNPKSLRTSPTK